MASHEVECPRCNDSGTAEVSVTCPDCCPRRGPTGWPHEFLEAAVRRAYLVGAADTVAAVLDELDASPTPAEILKRTHGLLAP